MSDVWRHEELLGPRRRERALHAWRRRAPQREPAVAVEVVQKRREGALLADEERRRAVTQPLGRLRQRETDPADLDQRGTRSNRHCDYDHRDLEPPRRAFSRRSSALIECRFREAVMQKDVLVDRAHDAENDTER